MERQDRDLKLRMQGPDVLQLQTALRQLGATITDRDGFFGQTTRKAAMDVQAAHGLPATGTAATFRQRLNAVLAPTPAPTPGTLPALPSTPMPVQPLPVPLDTTPPQASDGNAPYVVEGEVVEPDGTPLQNYRVRAFDRALGDWRLLGEAHTNGVGRYSISYDTEQLKAWGKTRADLKMEAYDAATGDTVLAVSPLILQALPHETIDFAIGTERYRGPDEYTRVETALAPHLQSLDDLSRLDVADVLILARQAKLVNSSVAYYVKAQRWAAEFEAPAALFYGLLRRNQPTRVDALLAHPLAQWGRTTRRGSAGPKTRSCIAHRNRPCLGSRQLRRGRTIWSLPLRAHRSRLTRRRLPSRSTRASGPPGWRATKVPRRERQSGPGWRRQEPEAS